VLQRGEPPQRTGSPAPYSLLPAPYSLLPAPYSLLPVAYSLLSVPLVIVSSCNNLFPYLGKTVKSSKRNVQYLRFKTMAISDTQVYIALVVALIPGLLAWRLCTTLYNS
jgi:photosystem I subunit 12